jgi:alkanesulfonate monooxygenase SsuD/methylene tetrahydromethanopterin reductase-like flavin-dependent oxidoreductase (luciferase family)
MRLNFALPGQDPEANAARHHAALLMAGVVDDAGIDAISLEEHHGVTLDAEPLGWCSSPTVMAAGIAAVTARTSIAIWGLALPLHDPIRIAEDVATLDLLAPGRVILIVNVGYRPAEFAAHHQNFEDRGALFDRKLDQLRAAWSGQVEVAGGEPVTPRSVTRPHPMLMVGGATVDDAERAGRHGLPFRPSADHPSLRERYESACDAAGHSPVYVPPPERVAIAQVAEDPDEWWRAVGDHLLVEAQVYASWTRPGDHSAVHSQATTVAELRAEGLYQVLTPDDCAARIQDGDSIVLHPLCGGTPLPRAIATVDLYAQEVLPRIAS